MKNLSKTMTKSVTGNAKMPKIAPKEARGAKNLSKKLWDKPVSQSFYAKLESRVGEIISSLGYVRGWRDEFMKYIDRYLHTGECPQRRYCEEFVLVIFHSLKGEIDAAIERSAACRRRAAERRVRKEVKNEDNAMEPGDRKLSDTDKCMDIQPSASRQEDTGDNMSSRIEVWRRRYGAKTRSVS